MAEEPKESVETEARSTRNRTKRHIVVERKAENGWAEVQTESPAGGPPPLKDTAEALSWIAKNGKDGETYRVIHVAAVRTVKHETKVVSKLV